MDILSKIRPRVTQTVPVLLEEELKEEVFVLLFARSEAERYEVHMCMNELEVDNYMKEYERSGLFVRLAPMMCGRKEVIEPIIMMKSKAMRIIRKEFRSVKMDADYIVDPDYFIDSDK